jgi:hypothetical protein
MDDVLAFIYTGLRKNKVRVGLDWLKLNYISYYDLEISQRNLDEYSENMPPGEGEYLVSVTNKDPEATAVYDNEEEEGTETGKCPFVVHGLQLILFHMENEIFCNWWLCSSLRPAK